MLVIGDSAGHLTDMDAKPARGTITRTDETQPRPSELDEPCPPPDRTGCGTRPPSRRSRGVAGYVSKRIRVMPRTSKLKRKPSTPTTSPAPPR